MKTFIYNICIFIFLLSIDLPAFAQKVYDGKINITPYELRQRGDSLYVDIDLDFSGLMIESDRSLTLIPILTAPGVEMEFPEILINGKRRHKIYNRNIALYGEQDSYYAVVKSDKKTQESLRYTLSLPYEDWMEDARLDLKEDLCGCGGNWQQIGIDKVINSVSIEEKIPYQMNPQVAYIKPPVEEIKARSEQQDAFLDFPVAKTNILPEFGNNPYELNKIEKMIQEIKDDPNLTVNRVAIKGFASPEGGTAFNNQLSAGRAEALRNYLSTKGVFPASVFTIEQGGEDWNGLLELINNSYMTNKDEIASIISYTSNPDQRKQKLKSLAGGAPYKQMLNEMYPKLRRVVSRVEFTVRGFTPEEAKEIFKKAPQQLSLDEMFVVANTYPLGSTQFVEVFETAVRMYPDDAIANHNAAATAIMLRDLPKVESYFNKSDKLTPEYINNLGVFHLMHGDYEKARTLFNESSAKGVDIANYNLEELRKKLESEGIK